MESLGGFGDIGGGGYGRGTTPDAVGDRSGAGFGYGIAAVGDRSGAGEGDRDGSGRGDGYDGFCRGCGNMGGCGEG